MDINTYSNVFLKPEVGHQTEHGEVTEIEGNRLYVDSMPSATLKSNSVKYTGTFPDFTPVIPLNIKASLCSDSSDVCYKLNDHNHLAIDPDKNIVVTMMILALYQSVSTGDYSDQYKVTECGRYVVQVEFSETDFDLGYKMPFKFCVTDNTRDFEAFFDFGNAPLVAQALLDSLIEV